MEISGLPVHALVVHAAVVLIPLIALLVIAFAVLPGWRWLTRWPTAVGGVAVLVIAFVTAQSGQSLLDARPFLLDSPELAELVETHRSRGQWLLYASIPFAALVVFASWSLGGPSGLASGKGERTSRLPTVDTALVVVVVLAAVAVLVLTVLAGDAGARAVWS
jgi:hypothetical protein